MKKLFFIITATVLTSLILSCDKPIQKITNADLEKIANAKASSLTKEYLADNRFIDLNMDQVNREINDQSKNKYQKPELAKAKAAIYRFYKNVSIKDGHYVHHLKSGKELNISEELFLLFSNNIKQMNRSIDSLRAKDIVVELPAADAKYLNSLLN